MYFLFGILIIAAVSAGVLLRLFLWLKRKLTPKALSKPSAKATAKAKEKQRQRQRQRSQAKAKQAAKESALGESVIDMEEANPFTTDVFGNPIPERTDYLTDPLGGGDFTADNTNPFASSQIIAGKIRAESIAALFFGDDAKNEVAALLSTILDMKEQGMADRQIARILANTRVLNPNIDYDMLTEVVNFYEKIMEDMGIGERFTRYNAQKKQYTPPYSKDEVAAALANGDVSLLSEVLSDFSSYNMKEAQRLPEGVLTDQFTSAAADALAMNAAITYTFDEASALAEVERAIALAPHSPTPFLTFARMDVASGNIARAEEVLLAVKGIAPPDSYAYKTASDVLLDIREIKRALTTDAQFALYCDTVDKAKDFIRSSIGGFINSHGLAKASNA